MESGTGTMKHKGPRKSTSRDMLSELPDEVLVHVLSFLPTLDAVRTILLRRFGNLWTLVHSLHFSDRPFDNSDEKDENPVSVSFLNFVRNVLIFHRRPTVNKFHLEIFVGIPEIEIWVRFALSREVKELVVNIYYRDSCTLPRWVFSTQSLVSLEIIGCVIVCQSPVYMGSLRKLRLESVSVTDETLKEIISGCPLLEELVIVRGYTESWLCITSTSIKRLKLRGWIRGKIDCPNLKKLLIRACDDNVEAIDVSSVIKVNIHLYDWPSIESIHLFLSFLEKIGNAKVFKLSDDTVHELAFPQNRWQHITLASWIHETHVLAICTLVRNSIYLEELTICTVENDGSPTRLDMLFDPNMLSQELSSPCVMSQLKIVTLHALGKPYQAQLQLVEFLLKSAINLDKLLFVFDRQEQLEPTEELELVAKLSSFQRASTNARIDFA